MSIRTAPCDWPLDYAACGTACTTLQSLPASGVDRVEQMAVEYLWRWTGRKYGTCPVTIRPCRDNCHAGDSTFWGRGPFPGHGFVNAPWTPVLINGAWFNLGCGVCTGQCGCDDGTSAITIPGPAASIEDIIIDGVLLEPSAYRVDNNNILVRLDGGRWPVCQNLATPAVTGDSGVGAWSITYNRGIPVPVGGQMAAAVLACEMAKAVCGQACGLPKRVQSITREGMTIAVLDAFEDIDTGHTGIWLIDSWVASVTKTARGATVRSPDLPVKPRRTTWEP